MKGPPGCKNVQSTTKWIAILHGVFCILSVIALSVLLIVCITVRQNPDVKEDQSTNQTDKKNLIINPPDTERNLSQSKLNGYFFHEESFVKSASVDANLVLLMLMIMLLTCISYQDVNLYRGARDRSIALCTAWLECWFIFSLISIIFLSPIFFTSIAFSVTLLVIIFFKFIFLVFVFWLVFALCTQIAEETGERHYFYYC